MTDLGDLIGQAPLGEQPATVTVDVYFRALAEIHSARQEIEMLRQDSRHARTRAVALAAQLREARDEIERLRAGTGDPMSDTYRSEAEALADALPPYAASPDRCTIHPDRAARWEFEDGYKCDQCRAASFVLPGGESTSAALRRAEADRDKAIRQRDEFMAASDKLHDSWLGLKTDLASARASLDARNRALVRARAQVGELIAQATSRHGTTDEIRNLISDLTDPDHCWFDHHGYCQAHGWTVTEPRCPHARARELLESTT